MSPARRSTRGSRISDGLALPTENGLETSVACLAGFISARSLTAKT